MAVRLGPLLALAAFALAIWGLMGRLTRTPSVLLITVDTLRADRLGCYGHPTNRTPAIDRLAREGMAFENAYCDVPWTTASMASVMTGQYGPRHGVQFPTSKLKPEAITMAELLSARGFQTGAVIGSFPLDSVYGLDQGFEVYDDEFSMPAIAIPGHVVRHIELPEPSEEQGAFIREKVGNDAYRPDEKVTDAAIRWLDTARDGRPFFLWVHYFGPHEKLLGNTSFVSQEPRIIAAYDSDVEATDRAVGRLIEHLRAGRLLDDTLLILHSDHGQNLGEHDTVGHGIRLDEVSVRVPLLMRYSPLATGGARSTEIVRNIDILPSVLEVTRVHARSVMDGKAVVQWPDRAGVAPARPGDKVAYFETRIPIIINTPLDVAKIGKVLGPFRRLGMRSAEWKYVIDEVVGPCARGEPERDAFGHWSIPRPMPLDPEVCKTIRQAALYRQSEVTDSDGDVSAIHPAVAIELDAAVRAQADHATAPVGGFALSQDQERKLRSLGYLR